MTTYLVCEITEDDEGWFRCEWPNANVQTAASFEQLLESIKHYMVEDAARRWSKTVPTGNTRQRWEPR